jgi:hypothetical protein
MHGNKRRKDEGGWPEQKSRHCDDDYDSEYDDECTITWLAKQDDTQSNNHRKDALTVSASNRLNNMFWGSNPEGSNLDTPYSSMQRARTTIGEAASINCDHLVKLQDYQIRRMLGWPVCDLLPVKEVAPNTITRTGAWMVPDALLGRTPAETASAIVKTQYTSREVYMARYGLGAEFEADFMATEKGRQSYKMSINAISQAVDTTASMMVIVHLMRTKVERFELGPFAYVRWTGDLTFGEFREQVKESFNDWARIQKSAFGYSGIIAESRDKLRSGPGEALNYVIAPRGADVYVRGSTEENNMFISGREAGHLRDIRTKSDLGVPVTRMGMSFKSDPEEAEYDPQFQNVEIGGFARMEYREPSLYDSDKVKDMDPNRRDVLIFNENRDDFERIRFRKALMEDSRLFKPCEWNNENRLFDWNMPESHTPVTKNYLTFGATQVTVTGWLRAVGGKRALAQFQKEIKHMKSSAPDILADVVSALAEIQCKPEDQLGIYNELDAAVKRNVNSALEHIAFLGLGYNNNSAVIIDRLDHGDDDNDRGQVPGDDVLTLTKCVETLLLPLTGVGEIIGSIKGKKPYTDQDTLAARETCLTFQAIAMLVLSRLEGYKGDGNMAPNYGGSRNIEKATHITKEIILGKSLPQQMRCIYALAKESQPSIEKTKDWVAENWVNYTSGCPNPAEPDGSTGAGYKFGLTCSSIPTAISILADFGFSIPISLLLVRPYQTYRMGTVIAIATPGLGNLLQGGSNFMIQDDAVRKMHIGHFTTHLGVSIERPQNVILTENALCGGHVSGGGVSVPQLDSTFAKWTETSVGAGDDMMVLPVPGSTGNIEDVFDITGEFPINITHNNFNNHACVETPTSGHEHGPGLQNNAKPVLRHYRSSAFCQDVWEVKKSAGVEPREIDPQTVTLGTNTMVFQQAQYIWSGDGAFETRIKGRDYWQDQVYAGVGAERSGRKPAILRGRN